MSNTAKDANGQDIHVGATVRRICFTGMWLHEEKLRGINVKVSEINQFEELIKIDSKDLDGGPYNAYAKHFTLVRQNVVEL